MKEHFKQPWVWIFAIIGLPIFILLLVYLFPAGLYKVFSLKSYLIFHTIVESLSIIISLQIFILSWVTHKQTQNSRSLFIGVSFLGVALLDTLHVLVFPGMPGMFTPADINETIYYWLIARLWSVGALFLASFLPRPKYHRYFTRPFLLWGGMILVLLAISTDFFLSPYFPPFYIEGEGLTPLKIFLEYVVMALALAAFLFYGRQYLKTQERSLLYLMAGLILIIISEMSFTLYGSYTDTYNLLGHIYKIAAYALFFHALFIAEIKQPYAALEGAHRVITESERRYRQVLENVELAVVELDSQGKIAYINPFLLALSGYTRQEVSGEDWFATFLPTEEERQKERKCFAGALQEGLPLHFEGRLLTKEGNVREVVWNRVILKNPQGEIIGVVRMGEDITEQNRAKEAHRRLVDIQEATTDFVGIADSKGRALYVNRAGRKMMGMGEDEDVSNITIPDVHPSWIRELILREGLPTAIKEGFWKGETALLSREGREIPVSQVILAHKTPAGDVEFFSTIVRDITERKQAEKRIQREYDIKTVINSLLRLSLTPSSLEEVLKQTIDLLLSIPWLAFEKRGGIFLVEDDPQVLVLKTHEGFALPIQEACAQVPFGKCLCGKAALSQTIQFTDGLNARHEISYEGIIPHGHYCIPVLFSDRVLGVINLYLQEGHQRDEDEITFLKSVANTLAGIIERKQAEEALSQSEARISAVMDNVVDGIININERGLIETFNPSAEKIFGHTAAEVLGKNVNILMPEPYRSEHDSYINNYLRTGQAKVLGKGIQELVGQRKDGSTFPMELAPNEINVGGQRLFIGAVRDLTEHKQLEEQLRQSQKMEAVGTLAGGVAHDFNNLLTAMTINLELAKAKLIKGESHEAHLEEIDNVIQRAAALTRQLLAFSRRQIIQPVPLNLNDTVNGMNKMLSRLLGEHIQLDLRLTSNLAKVKADPGQMEQVIMNLCINARDAMPQGGKLTLATKNLCLETDYINHHPWVEKGDYILLEVADTGIGMDKATQERIFEPFFTTKEVGKGTGLGLSMVFGIIKQHQGYINVYSEPGQGTVFKIYLPRTEKEAAVQKVKETTVEIEGGKETILLAEDEENLRDAIQRILEMFGYTVLVTRDGQEAVELYQQEKERIDLVILDAVMPRMGGMEAADYIYKLNPHQKILFSSGYSVEGIHEKFVIPPHMHFIQKPYNAKALAQKVREVLESK